MCKEASELTPVEKNVKSIPQTRVVAFGKSEFFSLRIFLRGLGVYVGPFEKPVAHVGRGLFMWVLLVACGPPDFHVARTCHAGAHVDRAGALVWSSLRLCAPPVRPCALVWSSLRLCGPFHMHIRASSGRHATYMHVQYVSGARDVSQVHVSQNARMFAIRGAMT